MFIYLRAVAPLHRRVCCQHRYIYGCQVQEFALDTNFHIYSAMSASSAYF